MTWLATLGAFFGFLLKGLEWLLGFQQRQAGRTEAKLDAAIRESERAKEAARIEADVRRLGDGVVDELRSKFSRD